jgi:hypothetical protein
VKIRLFLFLALGVLVMMGGSSQAQNKMRKVEKLGQVEEKKEIKEIKEKSPLIIKNQELKIKTPPKSSQKVEISYEGLFTKGVIRGKGEISSLFQNAQNCRGRIYPARKVETTKRKEKIRQGSPFVDSLLLQTPNQKIGKSPATFTNQGVISFQVSKKHVNRLRKFAR